MATEELHVLRSQVDHFLKGEYLSKKFQDLFELKDLDSIKKKVEKKKQKKSKSSERKQKREKSPDVFEPQTSVISTLGNASSFSIYATVRQAVLTQAIKESTRLYHQANLPADSDSDSEEDGEDKEKEIQFKLPKIVGLGLSGVFELVRESRSTYPELCAKALHALLDLLQGQQPEGMKKEPPEIVEDLFMLLMDLAINTSDGDTGVKGGQSMSSLACSALISLTIALGSSEKLLRAISVMLMSRSGLALQDVQIPCILTSLQKSVQAVLLGKSYLPDWFNCGIKSKCLAQSFTLENAKVGECLVENSAIASDGRYLYILNKFGIYKVGSGYGGTIKGKLESHKRDFPVHKNTFLGFAAGKLLCKWDRGSAPSLCAINRTTLTAENTFGMDGHGSSHSHLFSDGENIGYIAPLKDEDSFVIRSFSPLSNPPMSCLSEVPLKLTRKCMEAFGSVPFRNNYEKRNIVTGLDEDPVGMVSGKEFSLVRTVSGKVLYQGKGASLGIKQAGQPQTKWVELTIPKSPKIVYLALGHDGMHALMVAEDGSVYFVGVARRGEDGDSSGAKLRRQPKPTKPRKMNKLESKFVVSAACNSGTSAVVTQDGELFMFGKDTGHCDHTTGRLNDLKELKVTQVGLGKAHAVALTSKGKVFTFGINNKGQCGRDFSTQSTANREAPNSMAMLEDEEENEADDNLCDPGKHKWSQELCMICSVCRECTGYGVSCINSGRKDRNPGMPCGCGAGDSGCSECGACRVCAEEKLGDNELDERGLLDVVQAAAAAPEQAEGRKQDKMQLRQAQKLAKERKQKEGSYDIEVDLPKLVSLPPAEITFVSPAIQVAVGLHHTLVLLQNGEAYSFGSNGHGQLGLGDNKIRGHPCKVNLPLPVVMLAAGSHHSVFLLSSGQVYTCGDPQKGALGRNSMDDFALSQAKNSPSFSVPLPVPGIGAKFGRRATWIGASGDQTIMRIDELLINAQNLTRSRFFASKTCIGLISRQEDVVGDMKCLMISKADGSCKSFSGPDQENLSAQALCLDPVYDVLWGYNPRTQEIHCYNAIMGEAYDLRALNAGYCDIFSPELAVPTRVGTQATRSHCALHILGCLDTLTTANKLKLQVMEETREKAATSKVYSKEDYSVVNRFESHGGGWGYSGHSLEAVRFMCDTDILLGGFGLFGGRGGYMGRIKLFELGLEGGDNESDGDLLAETEETQFVCGAREKFAMMFDEPIPLQANFWYVAWARISGPSSDCGASGLSAVNTDDSVVFKFKSSKLSNNGTDVNAGQIPQLLYRLPPRDSPTVSRKTDQLDRAHILSSEFSHTVTQGSLEALLKLLEYGWTAFHQAVPNSSSLKGSMVAEETLSDLHRIVFICRACLRLLRTYVSDIYPDGVIKKRTPPESTELAESVGDIRDLLRRILVEDPLASRFRVSMSEPPSMKKYRQLREEILSECHTTFRVCFHAFYPTGHLKWWCLCDLLSKMEPGAPNVRGVSRLLAAVMEAMCHPAIKLTAIMPINCEPETEAVLRRQSMSFDDNTNAMARVGEMHRYPMLAGHMTYRMEEDNVMSGTHMTFKEVLDRLLMIVSVPVRQVMSKEQSAFPSTLIANTCALLTTVVAELSASAMGFEMDMNVTSRPMLVTPNRFMRASNSCQWNTGKDSPDGIAFSVDRPGIVMAGICVYGGPGVYEYEVEVLREEESSEGQKQGKAESRVSMMKIKGNLTAEDFMNDIAEIKFDRPLPLKESQKYAILLRNNGQRTVHGDSGITKVRCSDGTVFVFTSCIQSTNGTNIIRGQIPQILYYSTPQEGGVQSQSSRNLMELLARRNAIDITGAICHMATDLLYRSHSQLDHAREQLGASHLFSFLLPLVMAYSGPVAVQDPRCAVQILSLVQEILPAVSGLTRFMVPTPMATSTDSSNGENGSAATTTSQHYAVVESDHPYKPATVASYVVEFPSSVKWMILEFDPQCATGQPEDCLQIYIPPHSANHKSELTHAKVTSSTNSSVTEAPAHATHWPALKKFYGNSEWPKSAIIMPGHQLIFSLETATDYVKDEKASFYGFKCMVVGYESGVKPEENILMLERELAFLGGMCCSALIKKDITLPSTTVDECEDDLEIVEEGARLVFQNHSSLLENGFALSQPPTIYQALEGNLPLCWQSNEHSFLKDFVLCTPGTSGGRLARWLQPDSYLDPKQCEIECHEDLKCSWPATVTVYTKDQYGNLVNVPNLKMEVRAIPVNQQDVGEDLKKIRKVRHAGDARDMTYGGHSAPVLETPYEPTMNEKKDRFHSITMMKAYENYSFEELRLASPAIPRPSENMLVRDNKDGSYRATWTPGSVGFYNIVIIIDGQQSGDGSKVEVKEPPHGSNPPAVVKKTQTPRLRRFEAKHSAGLRVRVSPMLQAEQIGVIPPNCILSFVDETLNDDGMWLRLSRTSLSEYCSPDESGSIRTEGWCLQYNKHYSKTLLVPVETPRPVTHHKPLSRLSGPQHSSPSHAGRDKRSNSQSGASGLAASLASGGAFNIRKGPGSYTVIKCGPSGHNIRTRPSLKAPAIGTVTEGKRIKAVEDVVNADGVWIRLSEESANKYKYSHSSVVSEAWSLVHGEDKAHYLQHESDLPFGRKDQDPFAFRSLPPQSQQGLEFSAKAAQYAQTFPGFFDYHADEGFSKSKSMPSSAFNFGGITGFQPKVPVPTFGESPPDISESFLPNDYTQPVDGDYENEHAEMADRIIRMRQRSGSSPSPFASVPPLQTCPVPKHPRAMSFTSGKMSSTGMARLTIQDNKDIPPELHGAPVNELVKALGESRANGNGPTPQPSPPGSPRRGSRNGSPAPRNGSPAKKNASPVLDRKSQSPNRGRESSLGKEETFKTPPSSPVPTRRAAHPPLQKTDSIDSDRCTSPPLLLAEQASTSPKDASGESKPMSNEKHIRQPFGVEKKASPIAVVTPTMRQIMVEGEQRMAEILRRDDLTQEQKFRAMQSEESRTREAQQLAKLAFTMESAMSDGVLAQEGSVPHRSQSVSMLSVSSSSSLRDESPRASPKFSRKDKNHHNRSKRERTPSPSWATSPSHQRGRSSSTSKILDRPPGPSVKEALSPAVAECLRTVMAAFMWHEGIVHDAMACASFLKFHPDLTKEMSKFVKEKKVQTGQDPRRQRHFTESSKDGQWKRKDNINESRVRFNLEPQFAHSSRRSLDHRDYVHPSSAAASLGNADIFFADPKPLKQPVSESKSDSLQDFLGSISKRPVERHKSDEASARFQDMIDPSRAKEEKQETQLPTTLQHLVHFWEELSEALMEVIGQEFVPPSLAMLARLKQQEKKEKDKEKKMKKKKGAKPVPAIPEGGGLANLAARGRGGLLGEAVARIFNHQGPGGDMGAMAAAVAAGGGLDGGDMEVTCELCLVQCQNSLTHHMRQQHPGCGKRSGGKGYNSNGLYVGGWAGHCGEGGIGDCSWYLLCEKCRDRYMKEKKNSKDKSRKGKKKSSLNGGVPPAAPSKTQGFLSPMEAHHILKNNAQFLLELASASGLSLPKHKSRPLSFPRSSESHLPSVSESGSDLDPFPPVQFQYLSLHNAGSSDSAFAEDFFVDEGERVFVRSGSMSMAGQQPARGGMMPFRPRLPTELRHSPLARSGSLGQDSRPVSQLLPTLKHENTRALLEKQPMTKSAGTSPDTEQQDNHKKAFHRSISEYASENDTDHQDFVFARAVSVSARRRNNSGSVTDGGISLLKHPSVAMTRLITAVEKRNGGNTRHRPVMEFIVQRHDLEGLQLAMRQALRKSMCRVFAFQALNWLIRSVVQQVCLHDLLWFFVASLVPSVDDDDAEADELDAEAKKKEMKKDLEEVPICDHPMSDIAIAGKAAAQLPETFHTLLQTISDVMMLLPIGSALQQMAVRCYCLQFMQSDHQFLHESHVFSNLSRILSKSEEELEEAHVDSSMVSHKVMNLKDLTLSADIKASSRQAMIGSLTDNSTETFWESGDEDRNKLKVITLVCSDKSLPCALFLHLDNIRDMGNKVTSITINAGSSAEDLKKMRLAELDSRFSGWIRCQLPKNGTGYLRHITVEMKGPDQSLRLRQVKILGATDNDNGLVQVKRTAIRLQQENCEAETLKVFRILTSQVFGKLVTNPEDSETEDDKRADKVDGDNDLKEHMVSILFSRSKLSHMQKQVCSHIVQGIRREAAKMREEWDQSFNHPVLPEDVHSSDVYCFELVSMVVALSGSLVGRKYLAEQFPLIHDLFCLLHTATPRIQRQITVIFRRVLPCVKPQILAVILSIPTLPPADYNIVGGTEGEAGFDANNPGILDVFLACVAKALSVQMKVKSSGPSKACTTLTLSDCLEESALSSRWWLRGKMDVGLATNIMGLVKDMAVGKLSESWATTTKAAIAEAILNMTKLVESQRDPQVCVKTPTLWLALASLCVLDQDHVDRLSSGEWLASPDQHHGQPRPTCDNHDDGVTPAIILCNECHNLCADCDRCLHLPRSMRHHQRQVFKEEEEAIKVDLHEGCGRIKLFWVMSLVDSCTFKAMVEFREGKSTTAATAAGTCRFCGRTSNSGLLAIGNVCSDPDCQEYGKSACTKVNPCGHLCGGIQGEDPCLPCLHRCRQADQKQLKQDSDDMCMICFSEALAAAPAIQFSCSHVFHLHCSKMILSKRYVGARITFGFSLCPICKTTINHPALRPLLEPIGELKEDVRRKALMRLEYEGLDKAEAITTLGARFYQDPAGFAMERYAYYVCFKCNKAYYGGEARCDEAIGGGDDFDPSELVCGACSDVSRAQMCAKHGADFLEYKCRYCCSVAVFFCFGTTHFCNSCHDDFQRVTEIARKNLPHCPAGPKGIQLEGDECPLHVIHPPTGEEFALGCGVCRNAHTF